MNRVLLGSIVRIRKMLLLGLVVLAGQFAHAGAAPAFPISRHRVLAPSSRFDFAQNIEPFFYQNKLFYFAGLVALLLLGFVLYVSRRRPSRERELAALAEERTRALQEAQEQLELRVHVRTAALKKTNEKLQAEIHERSRAEEEVRRLNAELEQRVIERTAALQESEGKFRRLAENLEQLVAERTARIQELERERAESEKLAATGRMAARIAHEINNPLAGIKNSFLLLKDGISREHRHYEYVGRIEKEIERIAAIVRQMVPLYRRDQYEPRPFYIDDMLHDLVAIWETHHREKRVRFDIDTAGAQERLFMPEGLLRHVLHHLIQNAFDASLPHGLINLTAAFAEEWFTITVVDQGHGISDKVRPHIFEPFFTTKDGNGKSHGIGLGLSVSKNIVEALRGTLTFASDTRVGASFRVALPRSSVVAQ